MDETTRIVAVGIAAPVLIAGAGAMVANRIKSAGVAGAMVAGSIALAWTCSLVGVQGEWIAGMGSSDARLQLASAVLVPVGAIIALVLAQVQSRGGMKALAASAITSGILAAAPVGLALKSTGLIALGQALGMPAAIAMVIGIAGALVWAGASALTMAISLEQSRRVSTSILLAGVALAVGAGLLGTGSVKLGQYGFGVAGICVAVMIATVIGRGRSLAPMVVVVLPALLATLISCGVAFSSTPIWVWALLGAAPVVGWLIENIALSRAGDRARAVARIGVAAMIAGGAVAPGIIDLAKFAAGKSDDPYSNYK